MGGYKFKVGDLVTRHPSHYEEGGWATEGHLVAGIYRIHAINLVGNLIFKGIAGSWAAYKFQLITTYESKEQEAIYTMGYRNG